MVPASRHSLANLQIVGINMQDDKKEWLSAMVDNHADLKDLDQIVDNDENLDTWSRYHLMGDVMREETTPELDLNLIDNIESALAKEPTIVTLAAHRSLKQRIIESPIVQKSSRYIGKSAQFAVAASVALVTVMGVQQYQQSADEYSPLPVLQTTGPVNGTISPVSFDANLNTANSAQDHQQMQRDILLQQQRIKALLVDHQKQLKQHANTVK